MQVFYHLIYEYQKGLRDLCLFTCSNENQNKIKQILKKHCINYLICPIGNNKINIFFGMPICLKIIENFSCARLNELLPQEDFILGIMLGYGKNQQYERFLARSKGETLAI